MSETSEKLVKYVMSRFLVITLIVSFLLPTACNKPNNDELNNWAIINGQMPGAQGRQIYLLAVFPEFQIVDSAIVQSDTFFFQVPLPATQLFCLKLKSSKNCSPFFLEKGYNQLVFNAEKNMFYVPNSSVNKQYENFKTELLIFQNKKKTLLNEYQKAVENKDMNEKEIFVEHIRQLDSVRDRQIKNYIAGNVSAEITPFLVYRYLSLNYDSVFAKQIIPQLSELHAASLYTKLLTKNLNYQPDYPKLLANSSLIDTAQNSVVLKLRSQQKLIFWASWMPYSLHNAKKHLENNTDTVITISFDRSISKWKQYLQQHPDSVFAQHLLAKEGINAPLFKELQLTKLPYILHSDSTGRFQLIDCY